MFDAALGLLSQILKRTEDNRFSGANFRAGGHQPADLSVVAEGALESAAGFGQRFFPAVNHPKGTGNDTVTAAVANVVLHKDGLVLSAHNGGRWDRIPNSQLLRSVCKRPTGRP